MKIEYVKKLPESCSQCRNFSLQPYTCHNERGLCGKCALGYIKDGRDFTGKSRFSGCQLREKGEGFMKKKAYLASPFFTEKELVFYHKVIDYLRNEENIDLYVPMEHTIEGAWDMSNAEWAKAVFDEDVKAIDEAEYVFVINFGMYSDSGTAWEAGYAYAKDKKVVMIAPNFHAEKDYSLMMMNACCYAFDPITKKEINLDVFMQK